MKYLSLIGDVVDSKRIPFQERLTFQENLQQDLDQFNKLYQGKLVANLTITLGDEFQGLFLDAKIAFELITFFTVTYPYKIRFGLGVGTLYTNIDTKKALGSDGPVWWNARSSLDDLKKGKDKETNILIKGMEEPLVEELINRSLAVSHLITNWTDSQKELIGFIIKHYGLTDNFKQVEVAKKLLINKSKVSRLLNRSWFFPYVDLISSIIKIINREVF